MTCDMKCPEGCEDECSALSERADNSRVLDFSVTMLTQMDKNIPSDADYENVSVSVNAARIAEICDLLLLYAEIYEGVNVGDMFIFADVEAYTPMVTPTDTKH